MCNHSKVVVVYDAGGTYRCCAECGAQVSAWEENSGNGKHEYGDKKQSKAVHSGIIEGNELLVQV